MRTENKSRRALLHAAVVISYFALLYVGFFAPVVLSGHVLGMGDAIAQSMPALYSPANRWSSLLFSGYPVMGDPQNMSWYPMAVVFRILGSWNAFVLSGYVLASCFTYGFVHTLTGSRFAALVSGTVYGMSGFFLSHLSHTNMIHAAAWLPLLVWSLHKVNADVSPRWIAVGAIAVGCGVLAGHPQAFIYSLGLACCYALALAWQSRRDGWLWIRNALLMLVLGLGLAAVLFFPMLELVEESVRAHMSFQEFVTYSLRVEHLPTLFFPLLFPDLRRSASPEYVLGELTGYVGIVSLGAAFAAIALSRKQRLTMFWLAAALVALLLTLGASTPLASVLFEIPGYNNFRAQARHFLEFSFAISVLAGFGFSALSHAEPEERVGKMRWISVALVALFLVALLASSVSTDETGASVQSVLNVLNRFDYRKPQLIFMPVVFLGLGLLVLHVWVSNPSKCSSAALVMSVLVLELGYFGYLVSFLSMAPGWDQIAKPASLQKYEQLLSDAGQRLAPLRGMTQAPEAAPPNLSRLWGIPSVSGYNPLLLKRYSDLLGMQTDGALSHRALDSQNRSLDILSLRYLFVPRSLISGETDLLRHGMGWRKDDLGTALGSGCGPQYPQSVHIELPAIEATAIGLVTSLSCSASVPNGRNVLRVEVAATDDTSQAFYLKAGFDTSEWAWDRADVRPVVSHVRAPIFDSFASADEAGRGFDGHHYFAILDLETTQVKGIRLEWVGSAGMINLARISLRSGRTGRTYGVSREETLLRDAGRWRRVQDLAWTLVFENLRAMPRAWFVSRVKYLEPEKILRVIHESRFPDGELYDPRNVAFVEQPFSLNVEDQDPEQRVEIVGSSDTRVTLHTASRLPAFLVLSDTYYPGWRATLDGEKTNIFRTNYVLRGVHVPPGRHEIVFSFSPAVLYVGGLVSVIAMTALVFTLVIVHRRARLEVSSL